MAAIHGTPAVLHRIREVINDMDTPSWLPSVPRNYGFAAAGVLKADEWRTLSTVYFPIALVKHCLSEFHSNHYYSGELESTMMHVHIKKSKIKQWLSHPECPAFIKQCKNIFDK
ncbi:hypothetical protein HYPSUDRAFT_139516, partial [Hypholoma sublateritium FD-334 SS-4]